MVRNMNKKEENKIPYPADDWFGKRELDEKTEIFDYEVDGKITEVAFDIRSLAQKECDLIEAQTPKSMN